MNDSQSHRLTQVLIHNQARTARRDRCRGILVPCGVLCIPRTLLKMQLCILGLGRGSISRRFPSSQLAVGSSKLRFHKIMHGGLLALR